MKIGNQLVSKRRDCTAFARISQGLGFPIASVYLGKSYAESYQSLTTRGLGFCQEEQKHVLQMSDAQIPHLSQVNVVKSPHSWREKHNFHAYFASHHYVHQPC